MARRRRFRSRTRTVYRTGRRTYRSARRGFSKARGILSGGKLGSAFKGIGAGLVINMASDRFVGNPSVGTIGGAAGGYMAGGLWGLLGFLGLKYATTGLQLGNLSLGLSNVGSSQPLGLQVLK